MKKTTFILVVMLLFLLTNSCDKKVEQSPMNGYWLCTGISGSAFGAETPSLNSNYFSLFSIGYAGLGSLGYYTRVGAKDLSSTIGDLSNLLSLQGIGSKETWSKYFTYGSFSFNESSKTVTHILQNGETETMYYQITDNGNTLKLTTQEVSLPAANSVTSVINSIFGTNINTNVGVVYTYKKTTVQDIISKVTALAKPTK
ncbi:MAG: hypothetical protein LBU51_07995 [Bacteroidales bacterium]|nr:hypothetical protein [Bacteroidales bacterium]